MDSYINNFKVKTIETKNATTIEECKLLLQVQDQTFSLFHSNIRSLGKNFLELQVLLEYFKDFSFDCIVLTETWQLHGLDLLNIPGYVVAYNEGVVNKSDGVVI